MICRTAAALISRSFDGPLTTLQWFGLGVHALFCGPCRRFRAQSRCVHECCRTLADEAGTAELPAAARERIAAALDNPPGG